MILGINLIGKKQETTQTKTENNTKPSKTRQYKNNHIVQYKAQLISILQDQHKIIEQKKS
jgi:hypothetical protein